MELWDSSRPINFLKMGVESPFSEKIPSMEVSNFWVSLIPTEPVDLCLLRMSWIHIIPQVGETVIPPIRTGPFYRGDLAACIVFPGVGSSLPVLLTFPEVQRTRALMRSVSVTNSFLVGIVSA